MGVLRSRSVTGPMPGRKMKLEVSISGIVALISYRRQVTVRKITKNAVMNGWTIDRMTAPAKRIRITVGGVQLEAELKKTKTADEVYAALPVTAAISSWGEEFYFPFPGVRDYRETATTQVKVGDIAFWGAGNVLAIFFGRTPMSMGADPVPADRVNIIGSIVGDATRFRQVMEVPTIHLEPG